MSFFAHVLAKLDCMTAKTLDSPDDIVFAKESSSLVAARSLKTEHPPGYTVITTDSGALSVSFWPERQKLLPLPAKPPASINVISRTDKDDISVSDIRQTIFDHYKNLEQNGIPSDPEDILDALMAYKPSS